LVVVAVCCAVVVSCTVTVTAVLTAGGASAGARDATAAVATVSSTSTSTSATTPPAAALTVPATSPLTLLAQSPWVTPGQPFVVQIAPGPGSPPPSQLGVTVAVDACLSSVSGFDQSLTAPAAADASSAVSSTTAPLPLDGLPASGGGYELSMPVVVGSGTGSGPARGFTIGLTPAADQCGLFPSGVYPVHIQLVDTSTGRVLGGFTTHLIYVGAASGTQKLRFALVLPIRAPVVAATAPTTKALVNDPAGALAPLTSADLARLVGTVDALTRNAAVPVTLEISAQTLAGLQDSGHTSTISGLDALVARPAVHQLVAAPYVPVDAATLVGTGLGGELALQIARGSALAASELRSPVPAPEERGVWISADPVDTTTLAQLQADGYSQLVLPADTVVSAPANGSAAEPFPVATGTGTPITAITSSTDLSQRFSTPADNPVLAAHQLVAELAQIYYEEPNDDAVRAMVAVPPTSWSDNPAFVNALLGALEANPIIDSVTLARLVGSFPAATPCRDGCRLVPASGTGGLPVSAVRTQRRRVQSFATAAPTARHLNGPLGDLVLAGESELLRPDQQAAVLHNTGLAVDAQVGQVTVAEGQSITLTSQQGTLPVDIVSSASYPVSATLTVTSDKLLFPDGTTGWTQSTTLLPGHGHTDVVYVKVRARTSGVFTVAVTLHAPVGGLLLSSGQIAVRSTATSIVGIVLSLGAVVVLAVWWIRTSRKRRADRRAEEAGTDRTPVDTPR
jgi:hypothetical protein